MSERFLYESARFLNIAHKVSLLFDLTVLTSILIFQTRQPYWPEGKKTYNQIEVELSDVDKTLDFLIIRDFQVKSKVILHTL